MGNCCGGGPMITEELNNCKTIQEIQTYLSLKLKEANTEQEELKAYLEDKSKIPTTIDVTGFKDEDIEKRIPYLEEMKDCILRSHELLKENQDVDLEETKIKLSELYNMYTWLYDEEKRYENWMSNFKDFVENGTFEKLESENTRGTMRVKGTKTLKAEADKRNTEV